MAYVAKESAAKASAAITDVAIINEIDTTEASTSYYCLHLIIYDRSLDSGADDFDHRLD